MMLDNMCCAFVSRWWGRIIGSYCAQLQLFKWVQQFNLILRFQNDVWIWSELLHRQLVKAKHISVSEFILERVSQRHDKALWISTALVEVVVVVREIARNQKWYWYWVLGLTTGRHWTWKKNVCIAHRHQLLLLLQNTLYLFGNPACLLALVYYWFVFSWAEFTL